jgi:hypothetical protein
MDGQMLFGREESTAARSRLKRGIRMKDQSLIALSIGLFGKRLRRQRRNRSMGQHGVVGQQFRAGLRRRERSYGVMGQHCSLG